MPYIYTVETSYSYFVFRVVRVNVAWLTRWWYMSCKHSCCCILLDWHRRAVSAVCCRLRSWTPEVPARPRKPCNCNKSQCLKLYVAFFLVRMIFTVTVYVVAACTVKIVFYIFIRSNFFFLQNSSLPPFDLYCGNWQYWYWWTSDLYLMPVLHLVMAWFGAIWHEVLKTATIIYLE